MSQTLNLKIFHGDKLVDHKTLTQDVIKIGKLKSSHLYIEDDTVARMHAVIEVSGSDVRVIDLGSSTGTLLNGQRVEKNAVLRHGDQLGFGPYRVEVEFAETAPAMTQTQHAPVATAPIAASPMVTMPAGAPFAAPSPMMTVPAPGRNPIMGAGPTGTIAPGMGPMPMSPMAPRSVAPVPVQVDLTEVERQDGTAVAEVMAMYGRTVLDVQHVGQVKSRRSSAPIFFAAGAGLFVVGGFLFLHDAMGVDWDAFNQLVTTAQTDGLPVPTQPSDAWGTGSIGWILALLGVVPFGIGLARWDDKGMMTYSIGESHEASFTMPPAGLSDPASFPLVRGGQAETVLNFTPTMTGDVTLEGQKLSLAELVSTGRAGSTGGSYAFPIPPGAHCRVDFNGVTFHVNSVPPGKAMSKQSDVDKPFWLYTGGAFAFLGTLLVMVHLVPNDSDDLNLDEENGENRFVGYMNQPDEIPPEEPPEESENSDEEAGGTGQRHKGEEGKMGKPTSQKKSGLYAMKGPSDAVPQMARNFDPDMMARQAGILGMVAAESGHFLASPFGEAFAVGNDDQDVWGGLTGTEVGEAFGVGGLGLVGTGRGGGGTGEGTIGLGNVGLIGKGGGGGTGSGYGRGSGSGFGGRGKRVPQVRQAKADVRGALDKDIIRRVVRAHINEVRYCYNQGLVRDPNLNGRVAVQFTIGPTGAVPVAVVQSSSIKDQNVANCVAKAVKRWKFPKPQGGGNVVVTYPFVLSPG